MAYDTRTPVVLCWHMHQPGYQLRQTGEFIFPWVYLHAIKDYSDMAAHLENHPGARAVVNFAPILLEQLQTYLVQIERWRQGSGSIGDPVLAALVSDDLPTPGSPAFLDLMKKALRANRDRIINRFPAYSRLAELAGFYQNQPGIQPYLNRSFLADLLVWYHLGWMGETVRNSNATIQALQEKGSGFSMEDRRALLDVIYEVMSGIIPRYRALARNGQVELSVSPYSHPILPLLQDLQVAARPWPDIPLPEHTAYPGGEARAQWQLQQARALFRDCFGMEPAGCWASEGGLSQDTLSLLAKHGFRWTASGDSVIAHSLESARKQGQVPEHADTHRSYRFGDADITVFFRDDGLSDLIGFTYADWHAHDAVSDLVHHMENIARHASDSHPPVISVILDGENAWEYYPDNGTHFLDQLYRVLSGHPRLRLTTYSELLAQPVSPPVTLPRLVAGSWIYGTFSTWIGSPDKNRAWDLLCEAKARFDEAMDSGSLSEAQKQAARHQLALCEGSDWFWWFGDYNPAQIVSDFEQLYRHHLTALYDLIGCEVPAPVFQQLSQGSGEPARGGAMRPGHQQDGEKQT